MSLKTLVMYNCQHRNTEALSRLESQTWPAGRGVYKHAAETLPKHASPRPTTTHPLDVMHRVEQSQQTTSATLTLPFPSLH